MTIPEGYMKNARGELIPIANVKPEHQLEDELVRELVAAARQVSQHLSALKALAMSEVLTFRDTVLEKYGVTKGGKKGNMELSSFDGTMAIRVAVSEHLSFGPELMAAKELIDDCVTRWSEGANDNLRALVDHAFQTNKEGRIDTHRVLGLRRLEIADEEWQRAMEAIADAVKVTGSKTYIRFYDRDLQSEREIPIILDLANA